MWKWNFKGFSAQRGSESPDVVDSQRRAAAIPRVAVVPGTGTLFAGPGRGSEHGKWMEMDDKKKNYFKRTLSLYTQLGRGEAGELGVCLLGFTFLEDIDTTSQRKCV